MARCVEYGERRRVPLVIENMNPLPGDSEFQYLGVTVDEFQAALPTGSARPTSGSPSTSPTPSCVPGGTVPFVRAFGERIHSAQLSDNRGRVDEHMTIGAGTIDFRRVLAALGRIGFAGPLIIELFDVPKKLVSHRRLLALLSAAHRAAAPGPCEGAGGSPRGGSGTLAVAPAGLKPELTL